MAVIVIHAGMPKAGSSSIQRWLQGNPDALREAGFTLVVAPPSESGEINFFPFEKGDVDSGWMVHGLWRKAEAEQRRIADTLVDRLERCAARQGNVIACSEHFALLFSGLHRPTLAGLERLSRTHELRIAYYVRPQDSALEAAWRQAGYRTATPPSVYVAQNTDRMDYAATREGVRELAPDLNFEPRRFRRDLLERGDVVADFAGRYLGITVEGPIEWINLGLPLEVVNVLRAAPAGMLWDESYGNERIGRLKKLVDGERFPEDERVALSRQVLRKYAHERFGAGNAGLGWDDFVIPPEDPETVPGLEALDRLWAPSASPAELALLFQVLGAAIWKIDSTGPFPSAAHTAEKTNSR